MKTKTILATFVAMLCLSVLITSVTAAAINRPTALFTLTFIDVGQGDAALIQDPSGFTILIDGGKPDAGPVVVAYLRSKAIDQIDVMVATHPDSDHIGGLIDVLEMVDIPVQAVVYNGYPGDTQTWADFSAAVSAEGLTLTTVTYPQSLTWGSMSAVALNPETGLGDPESNAACLALLLTFGSRKALFACDLDSSQEAEILGRPINLDADVLKVAHHGSANGSSTNFLNAVTPSTAVISVGTNSYGHPAVETLARLENAGAGIWRTDEDGNITILSDGITYTVNRPFVNGTNIFLPVIRRDQVTPPPEETPVPTTEPTVIPTTPPPTPVTPTPPPPGNVVITSIFYDGVVSSNEPDEFVEIKNVGGSAIELQGWTLVDNQSHIFTFPAFQIQPDQVCRVYTNENHQESCGFSYNSNSAIWNNSGDCAYLKNSEGTEVSRMCY